MTPRHVINRNALYGMHCVIASVLDKWQRHHRDENPWEAIEFDKLSHCVHLLWKTLHARGKTSFDSAYRTTDGIHGPGPAVPKRNKYRSPAFIVDVVRHLQDCLGKNNPDVNLFSFTPTTRNGIQYWNVKPGRERTWLAKHLSVGLPNALEQKDVTAANLIADLLTKMTQKEIRALGTHQSRDGTIRSIEYNAFVHFARRLVFECRSLAGARIGTSQMASLSAIAEEVVRKTETNEGYYSKARLALQEAAQKHGEEIEQIVMGIFSEPASIWQDAAIVSWRARAKFFTAIVDYVTLLDQQLNPAPLPEDPEGRERREHAKREQEERAEKAAVLWKRELGDVLPELSLTFSNRYDWPQLRSAILTFLNSLPHETDYWETYEAAVSAWN